jgi:hypothetical protein
MASAATLSLAQPLTASRISWRFHLLGIAACALPFLLLAWFTYETGYISDVRIHTLAQAHIAREDGLNTGISYPPLPFIVAVIWPHPMFLGTLSALCAGAVIWLLWRRLMRIEAPTLLRLVLLLAFAILPSFGFLATQSFSQIATLLLFLLAWENFLTFTRYGETWAGFQAGLLLGLAFYFSFYAIPYALIYAIGAPFFLYRQGQRSLGALTTASIVISFPLLASLGSWIYVDWVFTGQIGHFLREPTSQVYALEVLKGNESYPLLQEVSQVPLYLMIGLMVLNYRPLYVLTFYLPLFITIFMRSRGFYYPPSFAVGTYTVVALAGLPRRFWAVWALPLILMAGLQVGLAFGTDVLEEESDTWVDLILTPEKFNPPEKALAETLKDFPQKSVLTVENADAIIAYMGTVRPLLLPGAARYDLAVQNDCAPYILVGEQSSFPVPENYTVESDWGSWTLYRNLDSTSLHVC